MLKKVLLCTERLSCEFREQSKIREVSVWQKSLLFFNHKGRVGKDTLNYNVAWGFSMQNQKVLMLDAKILNNHKLNTDHYRQKILDFKTEYNKIIDGLIIKCS